MEGNQCTLACSYKGTQGQHHFYVVFTQAPPILGLSSWLSLNLIQLVLSVKKDMLKRVHIEHMGMMKCKNRAKEVMFWPRIGTVREKTLSQIAQPVQNTRGLTPCSCLRMNSIRLWLTTTADILSRKECLPQLSQLSSASFAGHGIPEKLVSDNGPQFSAQEFAHFANYWDFRRITSSLTYPQLNGLAEKSVHIAKQLLKKSKSDNPDPYT